jgi:DNA repair protein RadC
MVIMHNHPSGDYSPSDNDKKITKKLLFASKEMDMTVLDHIITGSNEKYYSFYEQGLIDRYNGEYRTAFESFNV